jgi:hypothetical protein
MHVENLQKGLKMGQILAGGLFDLLTLLGKEAALSKSRGCAC